MAKGNPTGRWLVLALVGGAILLAVAARVHHAMKPPKEQNQPQMNTDRHR